MFIVFRVMFELLCGELHRLCHDVPEQGELGLGNDDMHVLLHGAHAAVATHHCRQRPLYYDNACE